jgi:hypothetical protein
MGYSIQDLIGLVAATALGLPVLLLPGIAIAYATDVFGFRNAEPNRRLLTAVLVATAVTPVLMALIARVGGLGAAVAATLLLAAIGVRIILDGPALRFNRILFGVFAGWVGLVAWSWIDFDTGTNLHVSLLAVDMVKHAATVRNLSDTGLVPPEDIFFLRDQGGSYYYFYFLTAAIIERLGLGLVDARMAVAGHVVWTGLALFAVAAHLFEQVASHRVRTGLTLKVPSADRYLAAPLGLLTALFAVGGLQLILVVLRLTVTGEHVPQVAAALGEQLISMLQSLQWVPHHVAGVPAAWCAFLALIQVIRSVEASDDFKRSVLASWGPLAVAAAALASSAGLTIWVTLGAVATAMMWGLVLLAERRGKALVVLALSGVGALMLSAPDLFDMIQNRVPQTQAIFGLYVRPIALVELVTWALRIFAGDAAPTILDHPVYGVFSALLNPLGYFLEIGLLFIGTILFWRARWRMKGASWFVGETDRLVFISAVATLLLGQFVKSTVLNNDLGWRVPLFVQIAALVWTAHATLPLWRRYATAISGNGIWSGVHLGVKRSPRLLTIAVVLGIAANIYDFVGMRIYAALGGDYLQGSEFDPDLVRDLRAAHDWLAKAAPLTAITQHNPRGDRALGSGLYGHQRVALSDRHNSQIFGASKSMVHERYAILKPVFNDRLAASEIHSRLVGVKATYAIVTRNDPVWLEKAPWVFETVAAFSTSRLRVIEVTRLSPAVVSVPSPELAAHTEAKPATAAPVN